MKDTLETCRRLYNSLLAERTESSTGFYEQKKSLVTLKSSNKFLKAVHSQVLQDVVLRLDKAFQAYFAGLVRHPKFKREGRYNSITYPQLGGFRIIGNRLKLSRIGPVKLKLHRKVTGTPKRCTIIRDVDQWFAYIVAEQKRERRSGSNQKSRDHQWVWTSALPTSPHLAMGPSSPIPNICFTLSNESKRFRMDCRESEESRETERRQESSWRRRGGG